MLILVVCGAGLGTSLILREKIRAILQPWAEHFVVESADVNRARDNQPDVIIGASYLVGKLTQPGCTVIKLDNLVDDGYLLEKIVECAAIRNLMHK